MLTRQDGGWAPPGLPTGLPTGSQGAIRGWAVWRAAQAPGGWRQAASVGGGARSVLGFVLSGEVLLFVFWGGECQGPRSLSSASCRAAPAAP